MKTVTAWILALTAVSTMGLAKGPVKVVTTLPDYASIARSLGGDLVRAESIAKGYQDAHFVSAKPSFARLLSDADLFVSTGLDLELWAPTLVDKSRNPTIREGRPGYVSAASGMRLLDIPANPNRAAGDIHIYGNPHVHTDPLRGLQIASNILTGLKNVDPAHSAQYEENFAAFKEETYKRLYGEELVRTVGGDELARLSWAGQFDSFLDANQFAGKPLRSYLGGWLKQAECLNGAEIVAYHKNWIYFTDRFGLRILDYVENKPGIPPSARHVVELIEEIRSRKISALLTANYYDESAPKRIEEQTGAQAVIVPLSVGGTPEAADYWDLFDIWIRELSASIPACSQQGPSTAGEAPKR
ncbi:MAG TPA: metal ABC transporter substrate-binding protein [Acidobacteriota bacterium]|nr:metal ABC transporter substrate-binding protein [Acidobacteriota bacterium]